MSIEISDYDRAWPGRARHAIDEVTALLPGRIVLAEHVGSTAVPGLPAKPVIDMMVATADLGDVLEAEEALRAIGYRRIETGMPERLFYRRPGYHLHVVTTASWDTRNERLLRDHLLGNAADRDEYGRLKRQLAAAGDDADAYTRGKTALIQRMVDAARAAKGLPSVDVWEE
ncbi:GrpB family protein [Actinoplanes sp. NPDC024001]|uniref:GrpB family protein n=1 Tax=Actinoplanes sp. NPDC024001 TaxID=3154598 RepID=UPI0033E6C79F